MKNLIKYFLLIYCLLSWICLFIIMTLYSTSSQNIVLSFDSLSMKQRAFKIGLNENHIKPIINFLYLIPMYDIDFIYIESNMSKGLKPLVINFKCIQDLDNLQNRGVIKNYYWDLGNGEISLQKNPEVVYDEEKIYNVYLKILTTKGNYVISNIVNIDVRSIKEIKFNTGSYIENYHVGDIFTLNTSIIDNKNDNNYIFNYSVGIEGNPEVIIEQIGVSNRFKIIKSGYAEIKISVGNKWFWHSYFFVSPIKTIQSTNNKIDWYRTQFSTGFISNGNCGPSCIAMSIGYQKSRTLSVSIIRQLIGLPFKNGAIGFRHMQYIFNKFNVNYLYKNITDPNDIFNEIDEQNIAIILVDSGKIGLGSGNYHTNYYGSYYQEGGGHYIIIKGYSEDHKWFVVYDPLPADWYQNKFRYPDGISMIGKNRLYSVENIWKTVYKNIIVVKKM